MRELQDRSAMLAHWKRLEELLLSARSQIEVAVKSASPPVDLSLFTEFIDHNEFGLAYEELVGVCSLLRVELPPDLMEVGRMMNRASR